MTDRLKIYNGALLLCGDRALASLSEAREPRHLLDLVWDDNGVKYCLEQGQWHFAMRSTLREYDPDIEPAFGFARAYNKPTDWINTSGVFQDARMTTPLTQYADEVGYWFADRDEIFVKYVSIDTAYGYNLSAWPATFAEYVKAYFASRIIHKLPGGTAKIEWLCGPAGHPDKGYLAQTLLIAKNKAAMALPVTFPSRGTWAAARFRGANRTRHDGGNPTQLIG